MNLFSVDIDKLANWITAIRLRSPQLKAWVRGLLKPAKRLDASFLKNRDDNLYDLAHNSQVVYIQAALNDRFDPVNRGIYISDTALHEAIYTYKVAEQKPKYLRKHSEAAPLYLRKEIETDALGPDFVVNVPNAIVFSQVEMKALVNKFKDPTKDFYISII